MMLRNRLQTKLVQEIKLCQVFEKLRNKYSICQRTELGPCRPKLHSLGAFIRKNSFIFTIFYIVPGAHHPAIWPLSVGSLIV